MPYTATADASPTGSPRSLRCRRPAASGHRAVAGELAALAFELPAAAPRIPVSVPLQATPKAAAARPVPVPRPRPAAE